jgi:hypothetical protein
MADRDISDFMYDFLKPLFLPGAIARIRLGSDFLGDARVILGVSLNKNGNCKKP